MKILNKTLLYDHSPPFIIIFMNNFINLKNMKSQKLVAILFLFCSFFSNSQNLTNWQVGINVNPFLFSKLNTSLNFKRDKQDFPNGFGFGLTVEKNWNERWGFKTGFESTNQNEKYFVDENSADDTHIKSSFKYYKIPFTIQYYYPLNEKMFVTFNQGVQISVLRYFKTIKSGVYQSIIYSSDYGESVFYLQPQNNNYNYGSFNDVFHNKNLFGIVGSIGLKGFFSEKISYSTNLRYEYDFTNPDKFQYYANYDASIHNFRIGLEFGLQYNFSINNSRFNKNPHKL